MTSYLAFSLAEVAAFLPTGLATLVGGVWLILASPRRGRRLYWAGVGLLLVWGAMMTELSGLLLVYFSAATRRAIHPGYHAASEFGALTKILSAPVVCVLIVRAAANPLARRRVESSHD